MNAPQNPAMAVPADLAKMLGGAGAKRPQWQEKVPTRMTTSVLFGLLVVALFVAGFGVWAATAPLSGAAVASGVVQASGQNLVVEHLEGGIIKDILVKEGDRIKQGDTIMVLDDTRALAERNRVNVALIATEASLVRAQAERDGKDKLEFPVQLLAAARIDGLEADLEQQRAEFANRAERHVSDLAVLDQRAQALRDEIEGLEIQKTSEERKLEVTREELQDKESLLKKGLTSRSQVNQLQRAEADSLGRIGALTATIGQRKTSIAEIEEQRIGISATRRETASTQINDIRSKLSDLREQLRAREDILLRSIIRAPADGVVVKLSKNTVGSVVRPGEAVVEILPTGNELIIDARISPRDIDAVKVGQDADLRLTALNNRTTPQVAAKLIYLSADRLVDPNSREPYYVARLEMSQELPEGLTKDQIYPGMPVEAFISTEERTFAEYLAKPIMDSVSRAFREE
ncbi:MAG: HlyD family type I secretion periplasmic adaptor subunit [Nitratireductor sp.]|nr:HlyD family type I secretion periplasmic adaptor subunit [Nitratireductor sp.]